MVQSHDIRTPREIVVEPISKAAPDALLQLCKKLAEARDKFTQGTDNAADLRAMGHSLHAVVEFLHTTIPGTPQLTDVLSALGQSLASLEDGRTSPVLTARPSHHGHSRPLEHELKWAVGAAAITLLVEDKGYSLPQAVLKVEQEYSSKGIPLPGQRRGAGGGLKNWRARLMERVVPIKSAQFEPKDRIKQVYDQAIADARRIGVKDQVSPADLLLATLNEGILA